MRIRMPKAEQFSPDPDQVSPEEGAEWLRHPATQVLVARLRRKAYRSDHNDKSDEEIIKEARIAQGVKSALEEIAKLAKEE
jgi:hypothetical protein